jgi:hypothetical protein
MLLLIMKGLIIPEDSRSTAIEYFNQAVDEIAEHLRPLIKTLRAEQAKLLGVDIADLGYHALRNPPYNQSNFFACEIFVADDYLVILTLESDDAGTAHSASLPTVAGISYVGSSLQYEAALGPVSKIVQSKFKTPVEPLCYPNRRFEEISEISTDQFNADDIDPASVEVLSQPSCRALAITIKKSTGRLPLAEASKRGPEEDPAGFNTDENKLIDAGLVHTEFIIICSKCNSHAIRIGTTESLLRIARENVRCACGKPISEETPQEILVITENGRILLEKSRWMSVLLKQRLEALGVQANNILFECKIKGSEIDCIANIGGELVVFELKDKDFGLREAYAFAAKIGLLEPQHAVVITTTHVESVVKDHFENSSKTGRRRASGRGGTLDDSPSITYVEGIENFRTGLDKVVSGINERAIRAIIADALSFINADPAVLINKVV